MSAAHHDAVTVVINSNGMGQAETALSHKLVTTFLNMLDLDAPDLEDRLPANICLYAEGVKLATAGSPVLEELASLAAKGVNLIVCSTCLNHFGLMDELRVGQAGGMKEIMAAQWSAAKVITL